MNNWSTRHNEDGSFSIIDPSGVVHNNLLNIHGLGAFAADSCKTIVELREQLSLMQKLKPIQPAKRDAKSGDIPDGCAWTLFGLAVFAVGTVVAGAAAIVVLLWRWALGN